MSAHRPSDAGPMSMITVHKFVGYDFNTDTPCMSRRWGSPEWIARHGFGIAPNTAIEVREQILEEGGLTPRSYSPDSQLGDGGFQRQVR